MLRESGRFLGANSPSKWSMCSSETLLGMFSGNFDASHKRDKAANDTGKRGAKAWGDLMDGVDARRDGETCESNDEL